MQRILLNAKSYFSLMWGTRSPAEVVRKAAELGYDAVALADRDGLYGLPEFLAEAKRVGIRAIVAAEVSDPGTGRSALLYPKNREGYANLCRILTERYTMDSHRGHREHGEREACVEDQPSGDNLKSQISNLKSLRNTRVPVPVLLGQDACDTLRCSEQPSGFNLEQSLSRHADGLAIVTDSLDIIRRLSGRASVYFHMGHSLKRPPTETARCGCRTSANFPRQARGLSSTLRLPSPGSGPVLDPEARPRRESIEGRPQGSSSKAGAPASGNLKSEISDLQFSCESAGDWHEDPIDPRPQSLDRRSGFKTILGCHGQLAGSADLAANRANTGGQAARGTPRKGFETTCIPLPCVIAPPMMFFDREDYDLHRLLRAIDLKQRLSSIPAGQLADERALFESWESLAARFAAMPEVIEGTQHVLDELRFEADFSEVLFPDFPCPADMSVIEWLRCKVYEGARKRYGSERNDPPSDFHNQANGDRLPSFRDGLPGSGGHKDACPRFVPKSPIPSVVVDRIERELDLIEAKGFAPYFLVVDDIVRQSPRTCGRGSGAASIVSYCLGITNVDPIRHNLMFERFLNPGRTDPPDIDVDFAWDERDDILDWVFKTYGTERSAMVANHIRFRPRMALRETARVFGLPESEISAVTHRLPWFWQTDAMDDLDQLVRAAPRMAGVDLDPPWPEIIALAGRLIGVPRGLSVHCGGVVLTPGPIGERAPVRLAAKGVNIIPWDKDGVEEMGLVKIDLLGNRSLAVIRDAIANIKAEGVPFDEGTWHPIDDARTQALLAGGRSMGVFYVESPAMRQLQIKTGRGDFEHLVINTSIIRPAANAYTQEYVRRVRGQPYEPIHPLLKDLLAETYGIMVYQEDVSRVAMAIAGFSCEQADRLRKIMSKKDTHLELAHFYRMFVEGAKAKGVSDGAIEEIWRMILAFSGYSFCKPHSASYTMVSYQSAYLKAHYPAAFLAAVMGNHGGYYSTQAYVSEARRWGIEVLPPDINLSERKFIATNGRIVTGLAEIKGLSVAAQNGVLEERRRRGPFAGLHDFLARTHIAYADVKSLILAGTFDRVEPDKNRPTLLWELKVSGGATCRGNSSDSRLSISGFRLQAGDNKTGTSFRRFVTDRRVANNTREPVPVLLRKPPSGDNFTSQVSNLKSPRLPDYSHDRTLRLEYDTLGFLTAVHPLDLFAADVKTQGLIKANDLGRHVGRTVRILSWPISSKTISTVGGEDMEFVSFEDQTDLYEAVLFPREYRTYVHLLARDEPVIVTGRVNRDFGAISVVVTHIASA